MNLKKDKKIKIKINDEFAVYSTASDILHSIKNKKRIFFEDGCYDVFLDFTGDKEYLGWYKRYGLLYFEKNKPLLFSDGENWKMFKDELSEIPYFHDKVEEVHDKNPGFYNLQEELAYPEENYDETFNCYYFEPIYSIKVVDFDTDEVLYEF